MTIVKLPLSLIRTHSYGGRFRGRSYHPRYWESKESPGNGFHTLYFSNEILKQINVRRGRRQKVPPRIWDSKKKEWIYKYRHAKKSVPVISNFSENTYVKGKIVETKVKEKPIFMTPFYYSDAEILPKGGNRKYRRGGKAHGRTYKIRREIFELFRVDEEFLHTTIINPEDLRRNRGKLTKVAILMPNFSVAVKELLFREEIDETGQNSRKGLLLYFKNISTDPKSILSLFPKRGPGSGESRNLITKFLDSNYSQLDNFDNELQDLIDQTWRSVLVNLIEMHHLNRNEVKPVSKLEVEPESCEYEYCSSPHIMESFNSKGKLVARECLSCGSEQVIFEDLPDPAVVTVRCKGVYPDKHDPGQSIRCITRTTDKSGYCDTHRPKNP